MFSSKKEFQTAFNDKLHSMHGSSIDNATIQEKYSALAGILRDMISRRWVETNRQYGEKAEKEVYYFSIEFLIGRLLGSNLVNCGVHEEWADWLAEIGIDINELENQEADAGLGNGGLGRLAACFLDSMASLQLPGHGCGIRYKYGLFKQKIIFCVF